MLVDKGMGVEHAAHTRGRAHDDVVVRLRAGGQVPTG